ncbi:MAG: helix-turn-helix domain-containing protein [Lachnospiraceae bacterium]|nr:helix-turn-helix domain-containing protein [Lachnospiraceae bacterium]
MGEASTSAAKEIGSKIRLFRKQKGWTQEVLAYEVGTSPATICIIEQGNRDLGVDLFCRIARALGHELSDFQPESVYICSENGANIDKVLSGIRDFYMGLDTENKALMLKQIKVFDELCVSLWAAEK